MQSNRYIYCPKTKEELRLNIVAEVLQFGNNANLNCIDTSKITDMSYLFYGNQFNGNISRWDVSNVTNMAFMFCGSKFNGDITRWDVRKVDNMLGIFKDSSFTGNLSNWNITGTRTEMPEIFTDRRLPKIIPVLGEKDTAIKKKKKYTG